MTKRDRIVKADWLKVGQKVSWRSQASGYWKEKRGEVYLMIPPGRTLRDAIDIALEFKHLNPAAYELQTNAWDTGRKHWSALIKVEPQHKSQKIKLYWPRIGLLTKIDTAPVQEPALAHQ